MANPNILTEAPPITAEDSFVLFERRKSEFNFPIHIHNEYELNFITGAAGARRIVGDHIAEIGDKELVLVGGSYLEHAWVNGNLAPGADIYEVTIQFQPDLFYGGFIDKKQFVSIKRMLADAKHGIAFPREVIAGAEPIIAEMTHSDDSFTSILLFLSLLNRLSRADNYKVLSHSMFAKADVNYDSRRISRVMEYLNQNYRRNIKLAEIAALVNMSEPSFSRFIKLRTGSSFIDCLNNIRLSAASRALIEEPTRTISEIAYECGFNNLSNFNRIFKKKKGLTPLDFRESYSKKKIIV